MMDGPGEHALYAHECKARDAEFEKDIRDAREFMKGRYTTLGGPYEVMFAATLVVRSIERLRNAIEEVKP